MLGYLRQVGICKSVLERIRQSLEKSGDWHMKLKMSNIPAPESILRAVSVKPGLGTEEKLRDFMTEYVMDSLHLTPIQREELLGDPDSERQETQICCVSTPE